MNLVRASWTLVLAVLCGALLFPSPSPSQFINVSETTGASRQPDIAVSPDATLHIVWTDYTGGAGQILHKRWSSGTWIGPFPVSDPVFDAQEPSIAVAPEGPLFLVAWEEDHGGIPRVWVAISDGVLWDRFPVAPDEPGPQKDPDAHIRPDLGFYVSWWDADSTIWVGDLAQRWSPLMVDVCFTREGNRLVEAGDDLAVVSTGLTEDVDCRYTSALWDGESWSSPGGETASASGEIDAASAGGDVVHLAALPGMLPPCPCWHLVYTIWTPPAGWSPPEVLSETFSEWWFCLQPDLALYSGHSPAVAYTYEELDLDFNTIRKDVVLARRQDDTQGWTHEYMGLTLEHEPEDPVVDFFYAFPAVAWSGNWGESREILLWAPLSAAEMPTATLAPRLCIWPNPSSGSVHLALSGAVESPLRILITDVAGRRVRWFVVGEGDHSFVWDGRDSEGRELGSGIYYVRTTGLGIDVTKRLIRIR